MKTTWSVHLVYKRGGPSDTLRAAAKEDGAHTSPMSENGNCFSDEDGHHYDFEGFPNKIFADNFSELAYFQDEQPHRCTVYQCKDKI